MADLAPTSTLVVPGTGASLRSGTNPVAGEAITAGDAFYVKASDAKAYKCDANTATSLVPEAAWAGIALNTAAIGQPVVGQSGGDIVLGGATTVKGEPYVLSINAGKICPLSDLVAAQTPPHNVTLVGFGVDTAGTIRLHNYSTGITR